MDRVIAREELDRLSRVESDPEQVRSGAVYKLKMMMRCAVEDLGRCGLKRGGGGVAAREERARPAGRVAGWVAGLRRFDPTAKRYRPTSRGWCGCWGWCGGGGGGGFEGEGERVRSVVQAGEGEVGGAG